MDKDKLEDNIEMLVLYHNNLDGHPVIGYKHAYNFLELEYKLDLLGFAKAQIETEIDRLTNG
tara:strand:- start:541 stop:726 length:186 start_codon:yes stop_codon:yes gene_type:complete